MTEQTADPRYPIGKYQPQPFSEKLLKEWLNEIRFLPVNLEQSILNMDAYHLDSPYREGGWTIRQLIHHIADSHMNAYIRFKLALTENVPAIKPYDEKLWAQLNDSKNLPHNISVTLLHALHARWFEAIKDLPSDIWESKKVFHPEHKKELSLWFLLGLYAWHSKHHVAHIKNAKFAS
jgi:hypothetical protein